MSEEDPLIEMVDPRCGRVMIRKSQAPAKANEGFTYVNSSDQTAAAPQPSPAYDSGITESEEIPE